MISSHPKDGPIRSVQFDPRILFTKAAFSPELQRSLMPYLGGSPISFDDICRDLARKQAALAEEEILILLLKAYLDRGK